MQNVLQCGLPDLLIFDYVCELGPSVDSLDIKTAPFAPFNERWNAVIAT